MQYMATPQAQFVIDAKGNKKGVLLSVKQYQKLMEDLHDLAIVAERRQEKRVPLDDLKRRLKRDGLL
jgi:PHD/YefM family antitoxin component YafN of YafNO toxin-antitoxin module